MHSPTANRYDSAAVSSANPIRHISDTALWVAVYRAQESELADAVFRDPYARKLAGDRGMQKEKPPRHRAGCSRDNGLMGSFPLFVSSVLSRQLSATSSSERSFLTEF
jgi:hypothetical protein